MAKIFSIKKEFEFVVIISGISLFIAFLLYVVYPPLRTVTTIYGGIALISLFFYTNKVFQPYPVGIPKKRISLNILFGVLAGLGFILLPKIIPGMSMGVPLVPASIESNLQWLVIVFFAPFMEEILTRGVLLGFVKYLRRKRGISNAELWLAIIVQAVFFMSLHALAYAYGWYTAPEWLGAFKILSSVSASLISAGLFGLIMGYLVTRKGVNSLILPIVAHMTINQILFVQSVILVIFS